MGNSRDMGQWETVGTWGQWETVGTVGAVGNSRDMGQWETGTWSSGKQ